LRIVALGGGTGLSSLLSGLKAHVGREIGPPSAGLAAIVAVTDNGGSSGRLREEFQVLPPGDIRNCMVALAEDEQLLTRLFRYRFAGDGTLAGHSFGNLFLTALTEVTGDFAESVRVSGEVLAIRGRLYPVTTEDVHLIAELHDGRTVEGEQEITAAGASIRRIRLSKPDCAPLDEAIEVISRSDVIVIGPGSLYTSLLPTLLVPGVAEAISASGAPILYICNCMTQPGETTGYSVEDHVRVLVEHAPAAAPNVILVNSGTISEASRAKYLADGAEQVRLGFGHERDLRRCGDLDVELPGLPGRVARLLLRNVIDENLIVRHDPVRLAAEVLDVASSARR